ncbi:DNA starvation/stationary phase protection protein [Rhodoblastus sphagnicola]|uniref:DNA starvation/stationary phase protection protein n=1 Tax=Rhodoblastus sphagnicola TaxID=333368 RepID=A0A2S6N3S4_9HYPH|nr:DNA starvation/stationary phase protection protein [Rhodoblastus sphagnicola]MBB4198951.1 starvation-inducible DNA-binding protein [Rhodoblastus sphagnicola]PPQ29252.1 DNA starvation/stationary phase protection protein [Rhodoblastus sphagnicola]
MNKTATVLASKPHAETPKSGLETSTRKEISDALGDILSAAYSLLLKTHVHHWNVVGPLFHPLHIMLEDQYKALFEAVDVYAERIRALGFLTPIPKVAIKPDAQAMSGEAIVFDLIADHEACVRDMREIAIKAEDKKDIVTHDMLVARMDWHEKTIWMLRAIVTKA